MRKLLAGTVHVVVFTPILILLLSLLPTEKSLAQTVTISGIFRPRFEVQYGYKIPPDTLSDPQVITSQRTRLNLAYNSDRFSVFFSLQDSRVWGDEAFSTDNPSLGLHEGWAQYNFSKRVGLKIGRQEFSYDNKRLLTNGNWPQQSRAYDAAVLKMNLSQGWKIHVAGSYNHTAQTFFDNFYKSNDYKTLDFLWINKTDSTINHHYRVSGYLLADGYQQGITGFKDSTVHMRYTYGINTSYNKQKWGVNFEVYGQSGITRFVNQTGIFIPDSFQSVKAYFFSLNPYVRTGPLTIGIGTDYMSGTNAFDSSKVTHMFSPQYGANDKFYGKIDLFFNMPADTRNAGLIDNYLTAHYNFKNWDFGFEGHYYLLQNKVEDVENPGQALNKALGTELDFSAVKDITKAVNINTGVALFFPTRSMEFVKATTFSNVGGPQVTGVYVYCMLTFHPTFFSTKLDHKD